jgi:hypothetical protein
MFPHICMPFIGTALLAGCTSSATFPNYSGSPADSTAAASPPSPLSMVLDRSIAAIEMAPSQSSAAVDSSTDPTTNMGDMKGMKMPGMGGSDSAPMPSGSPAQSTHEKPGMQGMQGMKMPAMKGMDQPQSQPATTQAAVIYTCTMHPQIQQDHPGNCPICGMTLIKKEPGDASQKGAGQ